jgi:hypothetical protein
MNGPELNADLVDLLGEGDWPGLFHPRADDSAAFLGRLRYSATRGTWLEYMQPGTRQPALDGVVHGMLESGHAVTLFSNGPTEPVMPSMKDGFERIAGRMSVSAFCVGEHFDAEPTLASVSFSVTGLDEFLAADPLAVAPSWPGKAAVTHELGDGTLEVYHVMSGNGISSLSDRLMHPTPAALTELETLFQAVRVKHPTEWFLLRTSVKPVLRLTFASPVSLKAAYHRVSAICGLLALLVRVPVHPIEVSFPWGEGHLRRSIQFCPTNVLDNGTVREARRKRDHRLMPVTHANAQLGTLLKAWLAEHEEHLVLVSGLQHSTGWQTRHDTFGFIVLYVAQLESIHHVEVGRGGGKHEYALAKYASPRLLAFMQSLFGVTSLLELATAVWELRNEISHYGRPKVRLPKLSWSERVDIARCLELVVVARILRKLGLDEATTEAFLDGYAPD